MPLEKCNLYASSTYFSGDATWHNDEGGGHRIDYVVCSYCLHVSIVDAYVDHSIDLAPSTRDDHSCIFAGLDISAISGARFQKARQNKFAFNKAGLQDFHACNKFEDLMWRFDHSKWESIDSLHDGLVKHIQWAARSAFGPPEKLPKQKWITAKSFNTVLI